MSFKGREDPRFCRSCGLQFSTTISRLEFWEGTDEGRCYRSMRELQSPENQYTIPNLKQRAKDGCQLCSLILRAFTKEEASLTNWLYQCQPAGALIDPNLPHHGVSGKSHQHRDFELVFNWSLGTKIVFDDKIKTKRVVINVVEVQKQKNFVPRSMINLRSSLYRTEPSRSTSSAASIDQVSNWIKGCEDLHGCYNVQQTNTFLPTRLVELVKGVNKLRLSYSDHLPPETRYATLSYCWGNVPFCRLLKENISYFKDDIHFSILPQTFQDAITVLQKLYIKYLWIDSLCIIQDSALDWTAEAPRMSKVYSNSYLNLAATASRNPQEGLFRTRESSFVKSCRYVPHEDRELECLTCMTGERHTGGWDCVNPFDWVTAIVKAPLNSRAWVYQERALAPRILHFSSSELFWECNHMRASETFPDRLPTQYIIPKQKNLLYSYSRQKRADFTGRHGEVFVGAISLGRLLNAFIYKGDNSPLDLWTLVVEDYSLAQLTYATDKLVAISALAETFARDYNDKYLGNFATSPSSYHFEDLPSDSPREPELFAKDTESSTPTYLAGLWSHQLFEQLLWHVKSHLATTIFGPNPYIAPSWSWASIASPIDYSPIRKLRHSHFPLSKLISAITTPFSTPFGAVTAGSIKVLGPLFEARLEPSTYPSKYRHYSTRLSVNHRQDYFYASIDDERSISQSKVFCSHYSSQIREHGRISR